ncbi:MAG: SUMF1/EgtB/PvdO family nonheme iron enzyme [Gammaproteobacteria bacterium]|nr:SUMF1/EgtB/PvdO family nonheme iron enzyme [Gammaproteobacteria bacterium]
MDTVVKGAATMTPAPQIPGYLIVRKLSQGGMATVYLAIQLSVGREVALKVMSPALNADPTFSERFQREANIVGQLSHPNIVPIYDIGCHGDLNYIAMDYLAGGSVLDKMATGISQASALDITAQIALALDHAHEKGYVHRDIKPENILFRADGSAVLTDFGVARTLSDASRVTSIGTVVGTPYYMSPEQARGTPLDGRADLYSLGVLLYEMLTGSAPFRADDAVAIAIMHLTAAPPKLPPQHASVQPLLDKLLAKQADDRFQRGRDVAAAIQLLAAASASSGPQAAYLSATEPTAIHAFTLLRALLAVTCAAFALRLKSLRRWLGQWRYSLEDGLHRAPPSTATEIRSHFSTAAQNRATLVTNIPVVSWRDRADSIRRRPWLLAPALLVLAILGWLACSIALSRLDLPGKTHLPEGLLSAAASTEQWLRAPFGSGSPATDAALLVAGAGSSLSDPAVDPVSPITTAVLAATDTTSTTDTTDNNTSEETAGSDSPDQVTAEATLPAPPPRYELLVTTRPPGARVRILNIREKYYAGIPLIPGDYHLEVTHSGYESHLQWIKILDKHLTLPIALEKKPVAGAIFHSELSTGSKGPAMVIVPAGRFAMGHKGASNASPVRQVNIARAFAVSQYEITFADYEKFSFHNNLPLPSDNRWGRGSRPVINISWEDARAYTEWLSQTSGQRYRLPTEAEWEYIARAGTSTDYFWSERDSDTGEPAYADDQTTNADNKPVFANCRRGCNSPFSTLLRARSAPVGSFHGNQFKVFDTSGNVAEWVQDCYQNHYLAAPRDGSAVEREHCPLRVVRGGSVKSPVADIKSHSRDRRDPRQGYRDVGFRVVLEL